jgi:polar amino acid transport system permease protein
VVALTEIMNMTKFILEGSTITLELFAITIIISIPLGILVALGKLSQNKILNRILGLYTWVLRGTPLLLQVFFAYFGLPVFGIRLEPLQAASIAFILNYTAYLAEIFRAGIQSVDKGQYEAAKALGMNYRVMMFKIVIPQAIVRVLPPTCNEAISLIKDTALVSVIGLGEISRAAKEIVTREFNITPFIIAAVIYLLITWVLVYIFRLLEKKYTIRAN